MRRDRDRDRRVDPRQLLDRDRVRERVGAAAAVLLRDRHPHQPELGQLGDELVREPLLAVELLGDRRHALERELPHRVAEQLVLGREVEVHPRHLRRSATAAAARPCDRSNKVHISHKRSWNRGRTLASLMDPHQHSSRRCGRRSTASSPSASSCAPTAPTKATSSSTAAASSGRKPSSRASCSSVTCPAPPPPRRRAPALRRRGRRIARPERSYPGRMPTRVARDLAGDDDRERASPRSASTSSAGG